MRAFLIVLALTGCATRTVRVAPGVVALGASELKTHGRAKVYAADGKVAEIHAKDRVDVHVRAGGDLQTPMNLTLAEMAAGCETENGDCIAERVVDQRIVVSHDHHFDSDRVAKAIGLLSIGGLMGYCVSECQDKSSTARAVGYTALGIGIFGVLLLGVSMLDH